MPVRITPAVKVLLIANLVLFLIQHTADQFLGGNVTGWLGLVPAGFVLDFRLWQIFTYAFLHADVLHLVLNLMLLAFIGGELEATWGTARFLKYYFFCSVSAGACYLLMQFFATGGFQVPMVGASGAVYGLLVAYGLIFSERVLLFMMLFPMKAKHFIWVLAGFEFFSTVFSGRAGLSSVAHLGGMAAGFCYLWGRAALVVYRKRRLEQGEISRKERKRKAAEHLKLVINNENGERDDQEKPKTWH